MDKTKQLQTATALAAVLLLVSILRNFQILAVIVLLFLVAIALDFVVVKWLVIFWEKVSHFVGSIVSKVLLSLTYYLFFTPLAWLFRVFNKQIVKHFFGKGGKTYYTQSTEEISPQFFERMW